MTPIICNVLYEGVQFSHDIGGLLGQKGIAPIIHPNGGHSDSGTLTYTISPTLVNENDTGPITGISILTKPRITSLLKSRALIPGLPRSVPNTLSTGFAGADQWLRTNKHTA